MEYLFILFVLLLLCIFFLKGLLQIFQKHLYDDLCEGLTIAVSVFKLAADNGLKFTLTVPNKAERFPPFLLSDVSAEYGNVNTVQMKKIVFSFILFLIIFLIST